MIPTFGYPGMLENTSQESGLPSNRMYQ